MRMPLVLVMACALGGGVYLVAKLSAFSGNRGIANSLEDNSPSWISPVKSGGVQLRSAAGRMHPNPSEIGEDQNSDARIQRALTLIDEMRDTDFERDLVAALGSDSIGLQVARGLIAGRHHEVVGSSQIAQSFMNDLKSDPRSGIQIIGEALQRIPQDRFEADRLTLLQIASTIPGMESDASDFALKEITNNIVEIPTGEPQTGNVGDSGARSSLIAMAHRLFIGLNSDSDLAYSGTLEALERQPDSAIRRTIIDQLLGKFPDRREELQNELTARQIDPYQVIHPEGAPAPSGADALSAEAPQEGSP